MLVVCCVCVCLCVLNVFVCVRCNIVCAAARFDSVCVLFPCLCASCVVLFMCGVCEVLGDVAW